MDNLGDILTEFYARGFSYLNNDAAGRARATRWVNEAYLEDICADYCWDFLRASTSGAVPLSISDLDTVDSVRDTDGCALGMEEASSLEHYFSDLTTAGRPLVYYFDAGGIQTYPVAQTDITVRYFKTPAELVETTDVPLLPKRWWGLLVDGAVVRALYDTNEEERGQVLEARFDRRMAKLRAAELNRSIDTPPMLITGGLDW